MPAYFKNIAVREVAAGLYLANALHAALPQTAAQNIYTVSGGRIIVVALQAKVTTVIGATATTVSVNLTPTTGTAGTTSLATATAITSKEVGTLLGLNASSVGGALVVGTNASVPLALPPSQTIEPGTISYTTSASTTGGLAWDLIYIPLDSGAIVTAV